MQHDTSDDEPFIMAEDGPAAEDSLFLDTDEDATQSSPQTSVNQSSRGLPINRDNSSQNVTVPSQHPGYYSSGNICELSHEEFDIQRLNRGDSYMDIGMNYNIYMKTEWEQQPLNFSHLNYKPSHHLSRYKPSLKHLIPIRKNKVSHTATMPLDQAGLFSYITYGWISPYMQLAYKQGLKSEDLPLCSSSDRCDLSAQRMEYMWKDEVQKRGLKKASLTSVVWKFIRTRVLLDMLFYLASLAIGFLGPIVFMRRLLNFCEDENAIWWHGALLALGMTASELLRILFFGMTWGIAYRTGIRLRSGLISMLYKKIMMLSTLGDKSVGELINIFSNDSQRIYDFAVLGPMIIGGPFVAAVGTGYILLTLGPSGLIGIVTFLVFYPVQYTISTLSARLRQKTVVYTDQRVRLMNELLTCVKLIKMYAWEKPFFQTVRDIRNKEQFLLEMSAYIQSVSVALANVIPIIAVIVTLLTYIGSGHELSPAEAFTAWYIMDIIGIPGYILPTSAASLMEMRLALKRIKSILCMEEIKTYSNKPLNPNVALTISNASFFWHSTPTKNKRKKILKRSHNTAEMTEEEIQPFDVKTNACLMDINIVVPKGRLIGICGTVASGKTSLLSAILGQLKLEQGEVSVDGSFAYVSQQPWITNCSLQDNILFGESFNANKYYNAVWASALGPDLSALPAGDQTEIGERGINLSGGQRQRVAIARALYADKDIYLLDDPLSAVDGHVAQHIFEHCVSGLLKKKTVFFVTHQLQFLGRCDEVIFMDEGRIVDQGSHNVLLDRSEKYSHLIKKFLRDDQENVENGETDMDKEESSVDNNFTTSNSDVKPTDQRENTNKKELHQHSNSGNSFPNSGAGKLVEEERVEIGSVPIQTYLIYIKYTGGFCFALIVSIFCVINVSSTAFSSWWLAHWFNSGLTNSTRLNGNETETYMSLKSNPDSNYYETVYGMCILIIIVSCVCKSFFFVKACLRASSKLHHRLFKKIFASPMRFFDSTPVGRLLNIFSRDMDEIDCRLPSSLEALIQNVLIAIVSLTLIIIVFPWFLVALIFLTGVFYFISRMFRSAIRDLKRIENTSRSPIYSHVAATMNGLSTIRAFGKDQEFVSKFMSLFDESTTSFFLFNCSLRWLAVRLDLLSVSIIGITASFVVAFHGLVPAAFAGLALAYSGQFSGMLQYAVRLAVDTESRFMSVQRLHTYLRTLESETSDDVENNYKPPSNWPQMGSICFNKVKMRYQPHLPIVLKSISFEIESKEKIGIVGRTGSGKSSLGVCLFRLVDLTSGFIKIDGINIAEVGLEDLRSKLSIIPQDPVLFIGTVRYNLDPFQKHSDDEIWMTLERTYMKSKIKSLSEQLESMVVENGDNFSVGERQLLCMARALLRQSKILILDEATAAIDTQTDSLLQSTLREAFKDCTVLTIAHRLNTVLSSDRILVLHDGEVIEFDRPSVLLSKSSEFSKMMAVAETRDRVRMKNN